MTRFLVLTLILLQTLTAAAAVGFKRVDDPSVPAQIRNAGGSIFRIVTQSQGKESLTDLNMRDPDSILPFMAQLAKPELWWKKSQFESCLRSGQATCHIFDEQGTATAFVHSDGDHVVTNLHVIVSQVSAKMNENPFLSIEEKQKSLESMPLMTGLIDRNGQVVFSPAEQTANLNFYAPVPFLLEGGMDRMNTLAARVSDEVEIHVPQFHGRPLPFASQAPQLGDSVYLVGFPVATVDRAPHGGGDSDGVHQMVSQGKVISFDEFQKRTGSPVPREMAAMFQKNLLYTDLDCEHGNSGGPVLNERGEVVGLFMAFHLDAPNRICLAITNFDKASLQTLWASLARSSPSTL